MPDYETLKSRLLREGKLFEDPDFPASRFSIKRDGTGSTWVRWKRPKEIVSNPHFIKNGATRFDLDQGDIGDCWFIAGSACLAVANRKLFERAVPPDQDFGTEYCGIFRFWFWHFDRWTEVVVDDRLPTEWGKLKFAHNREEPNEFWAALLEKAYAKLYGCYENIDGGHTNDALVDMTGGISEYINLLNKSSLPSNLFSLMYGTLRMNSMLACSISGSREESLGNGLYSGHAYSITNLVKIRAGSSTVKLIRLRNPWGRDEWTGPWNDRSSEWNRVDSETKKTLELVPTDDGEFWMEFDEWLQRFEMLNFCHLYPDALTDEIAQDLDKKTWSSVTYHDEWIRGVNAGGCGNSPNQDLYWINPQFAVTLKQSDDDDKDGRCTMAISLMQKSEDMQFERFIQFTIYKLREGIPAPLTGNNVDKRALRLAKKPDMYMNMREVTDREAFEPGTYIIVPATFEAHKESEFLLRIFTETKAESVPSGNNDEPTVIETPIEPEDDFYEKMFKKYTNNDVIMDASELMACINFVLKDDVGTGFGIETARSLLAMCDTNKTGSLNTTEFRKTIKEVGVWKDAYQRFDTDRSGNIDTYELSKVFTTIGFKLSRKVLSAIIKRYGGKKRRIMLEDFIHCCTKIILMYGQFIRASDGGHTGKATLTLDEWLTTTLSY